MRQRPYSFVLITVVIALAIFSAWYVLGWRRAVPGEPILALWEETTLTNGIEGPHLRFAIWSNGRMVHAQDIDVGTSQLVEHTLSPSDINLLKTELSQCSPLSLYRKSYLVLDAPCHRLLWVSGGKKCVLEWDEVVQENYGISISDGAGEKAFIKCWRELCKLAEKRANGKVPSNFAVKTTQDWR